MRGFGWRPYVPVHVRRAQAHRRLHALRKKGLEIEPLEIAGRQIAKTFWGQAWCRHLEKFSDYANRLPRGRTYVRNGSVCHMQIQEGGIRALVSGSSLYEVKIRIKKLRQKNWTALKTRCAGEIGSLLELLEGRLSDNVMEIVTDRDRGLFPRPGEIALSCSCPDWAMMCKHVAAVLYGVGARLDERPESLFLLRGVNHEELVTAGVGQLGKRAAGDRAGQGKRGKRGKRGKAGGTGKRLASERISEVFGIDMEMGDEREVGATAGRRSGAKTAAKSRAKAPAARRGKAPAARRGKAPAARRGKAPAARRGAASRVRKSARTPTGRNVAALRRKFGMTQHEFASLLGVGVSTVSMWEKKRGALRVRKDSLDAWRSVEGLTPMGARRRLRRLGF